MRIPLKYVEKNRKQRYIKWMKPRAKIIGALNGVPWKFIVAHTGIESGWGSSELTRKYFNFGGIKAQKDEPYVVYSTKEFYDGAMHTIRAKFKDFKSLDNGLHSYVRFFHENGRYHKALKYKHDPVNFAKEVFAAGYATDPNYLSKLFSVYKEIN